MTDQPLDFSVKSPKSNNQDDRYSSNSYSYKSSSTTSPFGSSLHHHRHHHHDHLHNQSSQSRKQGKPIPDELKGPEYYERRRKNNEAAKKSRDARRLKEEEISYKAAYLEQENIMLRVKCEEYESRLKRYEPI